MFAIDPSHLRSALARVVAHAALVCALAALGLAGSAAAQDELEDVLGGLGTDTSVTEQPSAKPGEGTVAGQVFDGETGLPLEGATVILAGGAAAEQEVAVTGADGSFEFPSVPPGRYDLQFVKAGYRASTMTGFEVVADQSNRADFPLPPLSTEAAGGVLDLEPFEVEASAVGEMMTDIELRLESDAQLNIMSAEDLSKFAAGDVAEALKRVAGINIREGQFAIIRGLEERYSSTLYNGAPAPSPDPNRQSVQLDLFASDIVSNLQVAKTFEASQPGNSSGGSIDIITHDYPDEPFFSISLGAGFNDNATDRFIEYKNNDPLGTESSSVLEQEYAAAFGGRTELFQREFRFKGVVNYELDYDTAEGFQEERQPRTKRTRGRPPRERVVQSGDLSLGELNLSGGRYDYILSEESKQYTGFLAGGIDLDEAGDHKLDASIFYTKKDNDIVERRENGFFPNFDYAPFLDEARLNGPEDVIVTDSEQNEDLVRFVVPSAALAPTRSDPNPFRGHVFYAPFQISESFKRERDLQLYQLNGDHTFGFLDDLSLTWAANHARTEQDQESIESELFFENDLADSREGVPDQAPIFDSNLLEPGAWTVRPAGVGFNEVEIDEKQWFGRLDLEYEAPQIAFVEATLRGGLWYEKSERDVDSLFFLNSSLDSQTCCPEGETPRGVAGQVYEAYGLGDKSSGFEDAENDSERTIQAWHAGGKLTFWEMLDLVGGVRREDIDIESNNDAFLEDDSALRVVVDPDTGEPVTINGEQAFDSQLIFPSRHTLFDAIDNSDLFTVRETNQEGSNSEILGIQVPQGLVTPGKVDLPTRGVLKSLLNGEIDEEKWLPSAGLTFRPPFGGPLAFLDGLTLRAAYSQTVARPSFREMGYYVTAEPGIDELVIGNPQLQLSDVTSYDARLEYFYGESGDLFAVSVFRKRIQDPIEAIIVSDLATTTEEIRRFLTFFNNQNTAQLRGIEVEARLHLGLFGLLGSASGFLDYFSIGGNYTYIDAEVDRSKVEIERTERFFGVMEGEKARFGRYKRKRRLFDQPEWIANADISFDNPDWGTKITLALFGISDVLTAPGSADPDGGVDFTLDRYRDKYWQLDLVASQSFELPSELGTLIFKTSAKNLTDSERGIFYDRDQTSSTIKEREFKIGRDYSFSVSFKHSF